VPVTVALRSGISVLEGSQIVRFVAEGGRLRAELNASGAHVFRKPPAPMPHHSSKLRVVAARREPQPVAAHWRAPAEQHARSRHCRSFDGRPGYFSFKEAGVI
jgi:hypothetical protein